MRITALIIGLVVLSASCGDGPASATGADLIAVVDGDTVLMKIDGREEQVRLVGLNTPEAAECHHAPATRALETLLSGEELRVDPAGAEDRDRFGRLLRYLFAGDTLVNLALVLRGHGVALTGDHPRADEFGSAADLAWRDRLGMWSPSACGAVPPYTVAITALEADPPGDDADAPNAEFVVISSVGNAEVDLSGWILRDESSANRFRFSAGTLLPAGGDVPVHSGCGADTNTDLYWCAGPVWSNGGDTAILQTADGGVVDRRGYRSR
jgi:endonuclease YncB( thermonuclease family)